VTRTIRVLRKPAGLGKKSAMNSPFRSVGRIIVNCTAPGRRSIGGRDSALSRSNLHAKAVTEIPFGRITMGPAYKARLSFGDGMRRRRRDRGRRVSLARDFNDWQRIRSNLARAAELVGLKLPVLDLP